MDLTIEQDIADAQEPDLPEPLPVVQLPMCLTEVTEGAKSTLAEGDDPVNFVGDDRITILFDNGTSNHHVLEITGLQQLPLVPPPTSSLLNSVSVTKLPSNIVRKTANNNSTKGLACVKKLKNKKRARKKAKLHQALIETMIHDPTSQVIITGSTNPIKDPAAKKYWYQRYKLFPNYDDGIQLDDESFYSVTPWQIAVSIAQRCKTPGVIIDAFCGCGGNTIQFAKTCGKVLAIDIDPVKIEHAKSNAKICGVGDNIVFVVADFMELAPMLKGDVVFLSPPWGGPSYKYSEGAFDIKTGIPMNGFRVFELARKISSNISYFVPRNVDKNELAELAGPGGSVEIQDNLEKGKVKAITAYYGGLVGKSKLNKPTPANQIPAQAQAHHSQALKKNTQRGNANAKSRKNKNKKQVWANKKAKRVKQKKKNSQQQIGQT